VTTTLSRAREDTLRVATPKTADGFAEYVAAKQRSLLGFAILVSGDPHTAEDLVQTALARAYLRWDRLTEDGFAVDAYLHRVIVNEHTSLWRRAWKRRERPMAELPDIPDPGTEPTAPDATWQEVLQLPPRQRAVVALRFYADQSVSDTAALLHCSEGTVKSQTAKALATLRTALAPGHGQDPEEEGR